MKLNNNTRKRAIDLLKDLEETEHPCLEDGIAGVKLILRILLEKEGFV